jgi:hypothetical protein
MKQITRYILALAAMFLLTNGVMAGNTATVIKQINGASAGNTNPGNVVYNNGTMTVTPVDGYYLTVADLTVVKTIDGQYAEARRRAPGINIPVAVTASDPSADPSKETTYSINVPDANYDYEITANFHTRTDISGATVTVATTSYMYDGTAHKPAVTVTLGGTTLTKGTDYDVYYADSINPGTGKITIVGTRTYWREKTGTEFTINKLAGSISYATTSINKTAIEAAFTNPLSITGDGVVSYSSSVPAVATVDASGEVTLNGVGTTVVTATVADGKFYTYATKTATYTLNVASAVMTVTASGYNGVYDGKAYGITVNAPAGATVKYGTKAGSYDLNASPTYSDAGTYTIYYQVTKTNYVAVTGSETVTITKFNAMLQFADYEVTAKIGEDFTPPTLTVNPANLPVTYSSSNTDIATVDAQTGEVTLVAPGKVNISAVFDGDANYYPASDFYILTVLHADIEPIDKDVVYTFDDEHFLYTDDEGNVKERKLDNTIIFDILFTLDTSGDPSESDGYDETEHCIVLNTEMPDSRLYNVNFMDLEPGSEEYAEEYIGLTFKVPAGTGYIIIDSKTDGEHWMKVQIGDLAPVSYCHTDREKDYIRYDCDRETWVHVYNGGPVDDNDDARMFASHRAKKTKGQVRIYSITRSSSATPPDGIEYINAESFDGADKWYDLQGNRIGRPSKKGIYILQGQKVIVR